jgi:hypothetical protein
MATSFWLREIEARRSVAGDKIIAGGFVPKGRLLHPLSVLTRGPLRFRVSEMKAAWSVTGQI